MSVDYWSLSFDSSGAMVPDPADGDRLAAAINHDGTSDLFVMSHGWGNNQSDATSLYDAMFSLIQATPGCPPDARFLGVFWPSIWFPEPAATPAPQAGQNETVAPAPAPGAADAAVSGAAIATSLAPSMPAHTAALTDMGTLIDAGLTHVDNGTGDPDQQDTAVQHFHALFQQVFRVPHMPTEDGGEGPLLTTATPKEAFAELSHQMGSAPPPGDTEGIADIFGAVWNGAKGALRVGSYFQMKARAGDIGRNGLGPFLQRLHATAPNLRVHLIGHSFGARLVSYALAGIPTADQSPVASLTLLQGAFSHWAFTPAADVPFDKPGALSAVADRVHGPLVATFTEADWAVGNWYPKASFLSQQDVEGEPDTGRWDGMGKDGFANANPSQPLALPLPTPTQLAAGTFYRVDANTVIHDTTQSTFAGAHSDIRHPQVAALIIAAATA